MKQKTVKHPFLFTVTPRHLSSLGFTEKVPLAESHDCSVTASYRGDTATGVTPYAWAYGYEWTIQILRYEGPHSRLNYTEDKTI